MAVSAAIERAKEQRFDQRVGSVPKLNSDIVSRIMAAHCLLRAFQGAKRVTGIAGGAIVTSG